MPQGTTRSSGAATAGHAAAASAGPLLDAFLASCSPTYHTPQGDVAVAIPFRMQGFAQIDARVNANRATLSSVATRAGVSDAQVVLAMVGRAAPDTLRRLTQALIDGGHLPGGLESSGVSRVRQMMSDFGLGLDCAGYARAAFEAAHPGTRVGFRPAAFENLRGLGSRGFVRTDLAHAQAGDLVILRPLSGSAYGHTAVVAAAHPVSDQEQGTLDAVQAIGDPQIPAGFGRGPGAYSVVVDGSFGSYGDPSQGGVQRRTWIHDNGTWVSLWLQSPGVMRVEVAQQPYGHELEGVYRLP